MGIGFSGLCALRSVVLFPVITLAFFPVAANSAEIRIGGTGNAIGTMRLLGDAFTKAHPQTKVVILKSIGTSGAIKAVPKGAVDIGLSSRLLTDEETKSGISATEYARTPVVFTVRTINTIKSITTAQIADIYSAKMKTWPDGRPVRPVLRQPGDDNITLAASLSPAIKQALLDAEKIPGLPFAVTDQESADKAESIPGSFSISTLALILSEKRKLRPLPLNGVEPTLENLESGRYPLVRHFYFVLPKDPAPAVKEFIQFVKSPSGRELLKQTGHLVP